MTFELIEKGWSNARTQEQRRQWWEHIVGAHARAWFWAILDACQKGDRTVVDRWLQQATPAMAALIQYRGPLIGNLLLTHLHCARVLLEQAGPFSPDKLEAIARATGAPLGLVWDIVLELGTPRERLEGMTDFESQRVVCGRLREPESAVTVPVLLAERECQGAPWRGVVGWLTVELVRQGSGEFYPAPFTSLLELGDDFQASARHAVEYLRAAGLWLNDHDVRWRLVLPGETSPPVRVTGASLSAALLFALLLLRKGITDEQRGRLDTRSICFKAAVNAHGELLPVAADYAPLAAAANPNLMPRIHTVVFAHDQPWGHLGLEADPLNLAFLRERSRDFHVIRAHTIQEAVELLVVNSQVRWRGIDCRLPALPDDHLPRPALREELFRRIARMNSKSGYQVIVGGAGEGKTVFIRELLHEEFRLGRNPVFHIIEHHRPETSSRRNIADSFYYQLLRKFPVPIAPQLDALESGDRLQHLLLELSRTRFSKQEAPEILWLDAACQSDATRAEPLLPGALRELPPGVVVVITTRPGLLNWLSDFGLVERWQWDAKLQLEDIKRYLETNGRALSPPLPHDLIHEVVSKPGEPPSFLTVVKCMDVLRARDGDPARQKKLRSNARRWRLPPEDKVAREISRAIKRAREEEGIRSRMFLATIGVLAVTRDCLGVNDLRALRAWDDDTSALTLQFAGNLFVVRHEDAPLDEPYRFYHPGYPRQVLKQLREETENGEQECHSRLADGCLRWRNLEGRPREYALRHLVAHLRHARRYDEAAVVLTDFEYLTERLRRPDPPVGKQVSSVFEVLDDCQETLFAKDGSVSHTALREQLEALYRLCCAHAPELNDNPTLLVPLAFNELSWHWSKETPHGNSLWDAAERYDRPWLRSLAPRPESFDPHPMQKLPGHRDVVRAIAYSSNGEILVSVSFDRTTRIYDARTGQLLHEPFVHPHEVTAVVITLDSETIITGCRDGMARLLDCETGRLLGEIACGDKPIESLALSPNGDGLAVGRAGGQVGVWSLSEGRWLWERHHHSDHVSCLAFSPDGDRLATGSRDRRVIAWRAETGEQLHELYAHMNWVEALIWSPCRRYLISGAGYGTGEIKLWDALTYQYLRMIAGHQHGVGAFAFSPNRKLFASGSCDETIRVVDLETGALLLPPMANGSTVYGLAFSPDNATLASAGFHDLVQLWRMPSGDQPTWQQVTLGVDPAISSMTYSHDGKSLLVACEDKTLRLRDPLHALPAGLISGFSESVTDIAASADNGTVVCGAGCEIGVWNGQLPDKPRIFRGHGKGVLCVAVSRDGTRIASGGGDNLAMLWDAATQEWIRNFEAHAEVLTCIAFAPDAKTIVTADWAGRLLVWDISGAQPRFELAGHRSAVMAMAFSPDPEGMFLATGDRDGGARLWNTRTGALIRAMFGHVHEITSVAFSPDGRFFATGSKDDLVRVWCVRTGEQVAVLPCARPVGAVWFGGDDAKQPILRVADMGGATHIPGIYVVQLQNANCRHR